jgi:hypothetical protein
MNRSTLVSIVMAALAAASCSGGAEEGGGGSSADPVPDHQPFDVAALLSRAGKTSNDHLLISGLALFDFACDDDVWSLRVFYLDGRPPLLDDIVLVAWDMPAGTFRGWSIAREADDPSHRSMKMSAEEMGFGCKERYSTSFFILGAYDGGNKVSRPANLDRGPHGAFDYTVYTPSFPSMNFGAYVDYEQAGIPIPDTSTYYLQNLFTGVKHSADVPAEDNGYPRKVANLTVDYAELDLCHDGPQLADVVVCTLHKHEGVEVTNQCMTVADNTLP